MRSRQRGEDGAATCARFRGVSGGLGSGVIDGGAPGECLEMSSEEIRADECVINRSGAGAWEGLERLPARVDDSNIISHRAKETHEYSRAPVQRHTHLPRRCWREGAAVGGVDLTEDAPWPEGVVGGGVGDETQLGADAQPREYTIRRGAQMDPAGGRTAGDEHVSDQPA